MAAGRSAECGTVPMCGDECPMWAFRGMLVGELKTEAARSRNRSAAAAQGDRVGEELNQPGSATAQPREKAMALGAASLCGTNIGREWCDQASYDLQRHAVVFAGDSE